MTTQIRSILAAASMLSVAGMAHATTLGLNTDPAGTAWNRGDANTGYAQWDSYASFTFTDDAPDSSTGVTTPLLSQSSAVGNAMFGSGMYNFLAGSGGTSIPATTDGDIIFQGASTLSFTLTGSTTFAIKGFTLQMKRVSTAAGLDANFTPTISINGGAAIAANSFNTITGSGDTNTTSGAYGVTTWYWDASLASNAATGSFTLNIPSNGNITRGIDFIAADFASVAPVTPVPEPGTWAIGGALLGLLAFRVYRTRATKACA